MAKKPARSAKSYDKMPRIYVLGGAALAGLAVIILSLISPQLGLITLGFCALAGLVLFDGRRRQLWEKSASFKFKNLKKMQESLNAEMIESRKDIETLREDLKDTQSDIDTLQKRTNEKPEPHKGKTYSFDDFAKEDAAEKPGPAPRLPSFEMKTPPEPKRSLYQNTLRAIRRNQEPPPEEPPETEDEFAELSDTVVRELLHHAIASKRVDVFIQPIMRLPQRQTRFYEMFARIRARPGSYMPASRYMALAEQDNLHGEIDILLLMHCLKIVHDSAHIQNATPFFLNITQKTLKNTGFMKRLLAFVAENRALAPRLVFEIPQADFADMPPALLEIIRGLGKLGCGFSLDHTHNLDLDIAELERFKVRFVKIGAANLLRSTGAERNFADLHRAKRKLEANGIGVIIEKIETETQLRQLLDFDIHYGQGFLFGKPALQGAYQSTKRIRRSNATTPQPQSRRI